MSHFRRSGPVIEINLGFRWKYANGGSSRALSDNTTLREKSMYDPATPNRPGWVVAVAATNRGRSPTSVLSLVLRERGTPTYQPAFLDSPALPTYLRPGEEKVFMVSPLELVPREGEVSRTITALATTIAESENQDTNSKALVVNRPQPPLPNVPEPVRTYLRDAGVGI